MQIMESRSRQVAPQNFESKLVQELRFLSHCGVEHARVIQMPFWSFGGYPDCALLLHPEAPIRHLGDSFCEHFFWPTGQICFGSVALLLHLCFEIGFFSVRSAGIRYDSFWLWIVSRGSKRCLLKREPGRAGRVQFLACTAVKNKKIKQEYKQSKT